MSNENKTNEDQIKKIIADLASATNGKEIDLEKLKQTMSGMVDGIIMHSFHFGTLFSKSVLQGNPHLLEEGSDGFFAEQAVKKMAKIKAGKLTLISPSSEFRASLAQQGKSFEDIGLTEKGVEVGDQTARLIEKLVADRFMQLVTEFMTDRMAEEDDDEWGSTDFGGWPD